MDCLGDVVYVRIFGQGLLFLNTYDAALDLLEKKGTIYSDKPQLVMAGDLFVSPFALHILERPLIPLCLHFQMRMR